MSPLPLALVQVAEGVGHGRAPRYLARHPGTWVDPAAGTSPAYLPSYLLWYVLLGVLVQASQLGLHPS